MSVADWKVTVSLDGVWRVFTFRHPSGIERQVSMDVMAPASAIAQMKQDVTAQLEEAVQHERRRLQNARKAMAQA